MSATTAPAIRIIDGTPQVDAVTLDGPGVDVTVTSATICGSDLHMLEMGVLEGRVPGHELAGLTPDGTAVAVEPIISCMTCPSCVGGERSHCENDATLIGIRVDGGLARKIRVPESTLVPLPSGLDHRVASLVEPLAVAVHGANRARVTAEDRVLIIGGGAVGLATVAVLADRGVTVDIHARYPHQQAAAKALGAANAADPAIESGAAETAPYDVVIDAVGSQETVQTAVQRVAARGRIGMLGVFWQPAKLDLGLLIKEAELIPAMMYRGAGQDREFAAAARLLHEQPDIATRLVSHQFPLDGAAEAFAIAADRAAGAIKVAIDPQA